MPAKPSYCAKLPAGIEMLRAMEIDWIDRRQLEEILGVYKDGCMAPAPAMRRRAGPGVTNRAE